MSGDSEQKHSFKDALEQLSSLRRFSGPPAAFWQAYLDALVAIGAARYGLVARKRKQENTDWRKVASSPANLNASGMDSFFKGVEPLCETAIEEGDAIIEIAPPTDGPRSSWRTTSS